MATPLGALTLRLHSATAAERGYAEILTCAVDSRTRKRGVGTLLVRWVQQLAAQHGLDCLLVAAGSDAVLFWEGLGFDEPPRSVPTEWCERLSASFEHSHVRAAPDDRTRPSRWYRALWRLVHRRARCPIMHVLPARPPSERLAWLLARQILHFAPRSHGVNVCADAMESAVEMLALGGSRAKKPRRY